MADPKSPAISKVTQKFQATIPRSIREVLGIHQGDRIGFSIENGQVVLKKVSPLDWNYLNALTGTLEEWASEEDEEAYGDL